MTIDFMQESPNRMVSVRDCFGIDSNLTVPAFCERDDHVSDVDPAYRFNAEVTLAILAGCHKPAPKVDNVNALINESAPIKDQAPANDRDMVRDASDPLWKSWLALIEKAKERGAKYPEINGLARAGREFWAVGAYDTMRFAVNPRELVLRYRP